jgi:hypothetical protein
MALGAISEGIRGFKSHPSHKTTGSIIPHISKSIRKTTNLFHAHDVFIFDEGRKYLGRI